MYRWDEMSYDIVASIDYVLNVTGHSKLASYIGYSLGCSLFYIAAIEEPIINEKVDVMISIAPTVSGAHLNNFFKLFAPFVNIYQVRMGHHFITKNIFLINIFQTEEIAWKQTCPHKRSAGQSAPSFRCRNESDRCGNLQANSFSHFRSFRIIR